MAELAHGVDFSHDQLQELTVHVGVVLLEDLHSEVSSTLLVEAELNFGVSAASESS